MFYHVNTNLSVTSPMNNNNSSLLYLNVLILSISLFISSLPFPLTFKSTNLPSIIFTYIPAPSFPLPACCHPCLFKPNTHDHDDDHDAALIVHREKLRSNLLGYQLENSDKFIVFERRCFAYFHKHIFCY